MKKSLIFAFVAVVAMLVASCKPSVEAPKARFSYDVDGMKVTFNNLTKEVGTLTFAWEFGDGATSTEKSPVHEYTLLVILPKLCPVHTATSSLSMPHSLALVVNVCRKSFSV